MSKRDYYEVLGVEKGASGEDIKKAFRAKASEFHPDRHPHLDEAARKGMEERFKEVGEAYSVLSDASKRERYDRFGHAAAGGGGGFDPNQGDLGEVFGDLFEGFFGGGRRRSGADLKAQVELDFVDAVFGKEVTLEIPAPRRCVACKGSGAKEGSRAVPCRRCGGAGRVRVNQGFFSVAATCPSCHGRGRTTEHPCPSCKGEGRTRQTRRVKVSVPAGVEDSMQMRVRGEGEGGHLGEEDGDLYVQLRVRPHDFFERDGDELVCELPVTFSQAALGAEVDLPLLEGGTVRVKVPAGSQPGRVLKVRGKGVPNMQSGERGDLRAHVSVEVPEKLSARQKELLEEFAKASGDAVPQRKKGFVEKARRFFE
ncbi:MAG TPA: molecular chaperone DnaJ [bacterium]|jgi:molecular chaperone DnaJ|nr:molecular chaperone DnaJ [bacterium]